MTSVPARLCAAILSLIAWTGLAVQFAVLYGGNHSVVATLWALLAFFTITTNVAVAILFGAIALGVIRRDPSWAIAGVTLCIVLVGVVYAVLLAKLYHLSGASVFANFLMHKATPVLTPLFWLAFARKGRLRWRDPAIWAIYPVVYFLYALARGALTHSYAYPFIDLARLGWTGVLANALVIAAGFLLAGWGLAILDHWLARRFSDRAQAGGGAKPPQPAGLSSPPDSA